MDKKSTRILLSILHICILGVCILTIYNNKNSGVTVAHVSFDTKTAVTPKEAEEAAEPDTGTAEEEKAAEKPEEEAETAKETEQAAEPESVPETETPVEPVEKTETPESTALYSFRFTGARNKLNIRSAPSMNAGIIAKVPVGGSGSVLELTDEDWAYVEYDGIVGYCSRKWIELQEITE